MSKAALFFGTQTGHIATMAEPRRQGVGGESVVALCDRADASPEVLTTFDGSIVDRPAGPVSEPRSHWAVVNDDPDEIDLIFCLRDDGSVLRCRRGGRRCLTNHSLFC